MNRFWFLQNDGKVWVIPWATDDQTWKGSLRELVFQRLMASPSFTLEENRIG